MEQYVRVFCEDLMYWRLLNKLESTCLRPSRDLTLFSHLDCAGLVSVLKKRTRSGDSMEVFPVAFENMSDTDWLGYDG